MNIQKMDNVRYSCTSLAGTNKKGILRPDANGYYRMPIGAIGVHNSAGFFYTLDGCRKMFEDSNPFMRRVKRGAVRGEVGHPKQLPGMSLDDFANRIMQIDERNICVQFKEIMLNLNDYKGENGLPMVVIEGLLIPSGIHGPALQKALDNPGENVCFSVRSFTEDYMVRGVRNRDFKHIVTFDWVNEPGIAIAEKFKAHGLENHVDLESKVFTPHQLIRACERKTLALGNESVTLTRDELFSTFGWEQVSAPKYIRQ